MKSNLALAITALLCTFPMSVVAQDNRGVSNKGDNAPIHSVIDFTPGFNTASLNRETDTPQHPLDLTVATATLNGETAGALHVRTAALMDWDVLRSPEYAAAPTTSDDAKTVLWVRGDAHTPTLMFEWDERNGTRWIATFPLTEQWQQIVLSPKSFAPWLVAADLARSGFHPSQAVRFRMGLDSSNTHTAHGLHEYWVAQIGMEVPPSATTTPAASLVPLPALSADAATILLRPADTSVTCQVGDRLQINGSVTMQNTFDICLLLADGVLVSTRTPSVPTDNYSFTWTPKTPGTHTLELRYTTIHTKVTVRRLLVTAEDSPPAVLASSLASAGVDTTVAVVGAGPSPFPLARVDFYLNNKTCAVVTAAPFTTTLPVEAITQPGIYPVKFVAYDTSGRPFYSHTSKIEVPQRVQVTAPRLFTLRSAGDKANLTASVLPGIKVAKISYSIVHADASHYETLADATSAPYSADVDLSNRASGDYWVRAIATSAVGNSYEAWAVQLTLTNVPDDKRVVQEAKDRAAAEAKSAAIAAEDAKQQAAIDARDDSDANLADTQKWICDTINKSAGTLNRDRTDFEMYLHAYFDGTDLVFLDRCLLGLSLCDDRTYSIPFDKMDMTKVRVTKTDDSDLRGVPSYNVLGRALGDNAVISERTRTYSDADPNAPATQKPVTGFRITFRNEDLSKRFVKAIRHAIRLSIQNKVKEPF